MGEPNLPTLVLYGANGYTARLMLPELRARGIEPVLAGRNGPAISALACAHGLEARVFSLESPHAIDAALSGARVVLNAAGPYRHTAEPLMDSCLRERVDYLDLSGELGSLEYAVRCSEIARRCDVMVLPAVGFDVVPSDSLALHLAGRLPGAEHLSLHISASNLLSRGSASTFVEHAGQWVQIRRNGVLEPMRYRTQTRWTDFGHGRRPVIAVSWGDLVTAFHSTRVPNIEVYFEATAFRWSAVTANQMLGAALRIGPAHAFVESLIGVLPAGPAPEERARERSVIVGEVRSRGKRARSRLVTPEAYTFTAEIAARIARRVLDGQRRSGFQTPASLLGANFVLESAGVSREDLE